MTGNGTSVSILRRAGSPEHLSEECWLVSLSAGKGGGFIGMNLWGFLSLSYKTDVR